MIELPGWFFSFTNICVVHYSIDMQIYRYVHKSCLVIKCINMLSYIYGDITYPSFLTYPCLSLSLRVGVDRGHELGGRGDDRSGYTVHTGRGFLTGSR
jgi:hypothetical protein